MESENQIIICIKVWVTAYACLIYCYAVGKLVGKGVRRLLCVIPVVSLFLALPLSLTSVHLCGITAFFLAWLATFKLLLFSFGRGPLSSPDLSLLHFLAVACLPIKIGSNKNEKRRSHHRHYYALKALALGAMIRAYDYSEAMGVTVVLILYSIHIYLFLDLALAAAAFSARAVLGAELEPQFDQPFMSTSLQDFWGRRWNLTVTRILRPTVYDPVLAAADRVVGKKLAGLLAVMGTFAVSGLMHELIFFYMGRLRPTWEVTRFFFLHGFCLAVEIEVKRVVAGRFAFPRVVSGALTVVFVFTTGFWFFFPPFLRFQADVRAFEEYAAMGAFFKGLGDAAFNFTGSRLPRVESQLF